MNNLSELIKPVFIKAGNRQQTLRFDPATNQIVMDPINIADLNLKDFTRIHGFFRKVQGLRYNILQDQAQEQIESLRFKDLSTYDFFKSPAFPQATLRKLTGHGAEIKAGHVVIQNGRYAVSSGIITVEPDTLVEVLNGTRTQA